MKSHPRNGAHQELELKLCLPGADPAVLAKRLARTPALARRKPLQQSLFNIYFDTPDQALRQRNVALRLRRVGSAAHSQWLQTLKTSTGERSALSQRGEWESEVPGPALDLAALARHTLDRHRPDGVSLSPWRRALSPVSSALFGWCAGATAVRWKWPWTSDRLKQTVSRPPFASLNLN